MKALFVLVCRFDSHIEELVQTQASRPEHLTDSRIQRMRILPLLAVTVLFLVLPFLGLTFVASTLGLCRPEDYDLIRVIELDNKLLPGLCLKLVCPQGVSSEAKQAAFMDALLDLVCLSQEAEYATPNSHLSLEPTRQDCCRIAWSPTKSSFCFSAKAALQG
jgi:hypothetical protein